MQKKIRFRTPPFTSVQSSLHTLSLSLSLSLPAPTASWLPFKSNSDFHFPMPLALVMNHGLGLEFQVGTRLHFSKSKSDFPYPSLLDSDSKPSSLSLINWSFPSVLCSLFSLLSSLSSDFKISPFHFETNTPLHQNLSIFFTPSSCGLLLLLPHNLPDAVVFTPWVFSTF